MLKQVSTIFAPPVFPGNEDKTRKARYANVIAFEVFVRAFANYTNVSILDLSLFVVVAICIIDLILLRRGYVQLTSILLVVLTWIAANGLAATGFGAKDSSYILNFAIVLMAGLLLSGKASVIVTSFSIGSGFALAYAEQNGWIRVTSYPIMSFARDIAFVFGLNGVLIILLISGLESALKKSRTNLVELESANKNLSSTQGELQQRTNELTVANKQLENRARKLRAITMIARTTASIQDFELLLASMTNTISKELGYYYVGLFLLDEQKQYAILRSANTSSGQNMISRGFRLPIRQKGIIGFVVQSGQPHIIPNTKRDNLFVTNPELSETQSEMLLPLKSGHQIIGVLDIHATETNAFSEDDLSTLSILADQVAITIQNLLLYEQSQSALREAGINSLQMSSEAWKIYEKRIQPKGYRYDGIKSEPLKDGKVSNLAKDSLLIPVQVRGQTIGRLKLNAFDPARTWTEDELAMVKATAERVALALEGTRLLEEAQKRAAREAFLSDVATKLSASFQLDSILRDTVQELGQNLKNSTVTFQLVNPAEASAQKPEQVDRASAHKKELGADND